MIILVSFDHKIYESLNHSLTSPSSSLLHFPSGSFTAQEVLQHYDLPEEHHSLMIKEGQNRRKMLETIWRVWKLVRMYKVFKRFHCTSLPIISVFYFVGKLYFCDLLQGVIRASAESLCLPTSSMINGILSLHFSEAICTHLVTYSTGK